RAKRSIVASCRLPFGIPNFSFASLIASLPPIFPRHTRAPVQKSSFPLRAPFRFRPTLEKNSSGSPRDKRRDRQHPPAPESHRRHNQYAVPAPSKRARLIRPFSKVCFATG